MAQAEELTVFVRDALVRGEKRPVIEETLLRAGWSARQVGDALSAFADVPFAIPVPKPRRYTDARESFLYGVLFIALALSAWNLGALVFGLIERVFPASGDGIGWRENMRWPIALLTVSVPVLFYVTSLINRELRQDPAARASRTRSQMTWLTLFVCAGVVIGTLAAVVYALLGGELTIRFILKSLTAAVIASAIFGYYRSDMRLAAPPPT